MWDYIYIDLICNAILQTSVDESSYGFDLPSLMHAYLDLSLSLSLSLLALLLYNFAIASAWHLKWAKFEEHHFLFFLFGKLAELRWIWNDLLNRFVDRVGGGCVVWAQVVPVCICYGT